MTKDQNEGLSLWCTFSVRYQQAGKTCILMPGQALPVYDTATLGRQGPEFDIVLVTLSVREKDSEFLPAAGAPALGRARYAAACDLQAKGADTEMERAIVQQAQLYPLGGASGITVLRPHRLPIGVGVHAEPVTSQDPRLGSEERPITLAQADPIARRMGPARIPTVFLPLPKLYAELADGTGDKQAAAVGTSAPGQVRLVETLLPVCACPLGEDVDALEMCTKAVAHLRRLGAVRVWLGLDLLTVEHADQPYVIPDPVPVEEVKVGRAVSPKLYTLPHGGAADYWLPLRFDTKARVNALYRGQDRTDLDFFPMFQGETSTVESVAPVAISVLEDAGMPVT